MRTTHVRVRGITGFHFRLSFDRKPSLAIAGARASVAGAQGLRLLSNKNTFTEFIGDPLVVPFEMTFEDQPARAESACP
jgi:hypothetical protein